MACEICCTLPPPAHRLEIQKMVTPQFYLSHSFMMGAKMPHVETGALYDFSTHVVLPGNQLLMARLGHGGSIDGRWVVRGVVCT